MTCQSCAHWQTDHHYESLYPWGTSADLVNRNFGLCNCPQMVKTCHFGGAQDLRDVPVDGALVEYDEDWGIITGRDFGCVHHSQREAEDV